MISLDDVRAALALPNVDAVLARQPMTPGSRKVLPPQKNAKSRQAGVLVLLFPQADGLHLILTRRTETLRGHSGQISFPGGQHDPNDATLADTALRETCEELGVCDEVVQILGCLSTLYIAPSDFEVSPWVGALEKRPVFMPNPEEVAEVFTVPLAALLDATYKRMEQRDFRGITIDVPYYAFGGHKVWGATAMMLSELENRLRAVLPGPSL